jgi:hypothetical protein
MAMEKDLLVCKAERREEADDFDGFEADGDDLADEAKNKRVYR